MLVAELLVGLRSRELHLDQVRIDQPLLARGFVMEPGLPQRRETRLLRMPFRFVLRMPPGLLVGMTAGFVVGMTLRFVVGVPLGFVVGVPTGLVLLMTAGLVLA